MKSWLTYLLSASVLGVAAAIQGQDAPVSTPPQAQTAPAPKAPPPGDLSYSANEVIKLHQNGIGDEVVRSFIANSNFRYELSASDIVYLHQLGISAPLITGMIMHDQQIRESAPAARSPVTQYVEQTPVAAPPAEVAAFWR